MPGFMPGIHVLEISISEKKDVDGRDKPGHDGQSISVKTKMPGASRAFLLNKTVRGGRRPPQNQ
ncbi:hypothetical protein [Afipia carboxidovorans]|uniref:hypothetical protein n=1 Tax=Afipia carboxidovorans TaxID=40137 RepID=UPI0002F077CA|nr:hypothetical protein [Afipia carboxidovorans]